MWEYQLLLRNDKRLNPDTSPPFDERIEIKVVPPNTRIDVAIVDQPIQMKIKVWREEKLISKQDFEGNYFIVPCEEGLYTYNIESRLSKKTEFGTVFFIEVKN